VVTSAPLRVARRRLAVAGLPTPPLLIGAEDVGASKPDPEGFLHAARVLGVPIEECLAVEDSPAGIEAAARSGAAVLQVGSAPHPWPVVHAVPDLTHVRAQLTAARQVRLTVGPPR
jgi:sugar-phosphatase